MAPLTATLRTGFEYSDCWVDDARLVVINAIDAHERGAHVAVRSALTAARREADNWVVTITNRAGEQRVLRARALVNAAGPWVENVLKVVGVPRGGGLRLVKGSHIIVPRLYEGPHAYTLQSADGRVVFIIPYQDYFTLIGTTDVPFTGDPAVANASAEEVAYLCDVASRYLTIPVRPSDVVWTYAGVRPLYDDGSQNASHVTRDYVLDIAAPAGQAPLISIFGGKITTYRTLAEHVLQALAPSLGITVGRWTRAGILPGGDLRSGNFEAFVAQKVAQYASLDRSMVRRLCRAYGTRLDQILGSDLGAEVVPGLFEAELRYMRDCEWAQSAEDALWRRSKLGLTLDAAEREKVTAWFGS